MLTETPLLRREPTFDCISPFNRWAMRSLLPFLGDALSWLTGTATTKDVRSIKNRVQQLIAMQHQQQETLVHIISILNVTRYATQVNRQHINLVTDAVERTHQDITTVYNITSSLYTSLNYQQIVLHICFILANLGDSLYYMRQVTIHVMDYIDAVITGILSPHVLPLDFWKMLIHIEEVLPSTVQHSSKLKHPSTFFIYHQWYWQFHQMTHFTSIDTYTPMFWLQINNSSYSLIYPYRMLHNNLKYVKSSI